MYTYTRTYIYIHTYIYYTVFEIFGGSEDLAQHNGRNDVEHGGIQLDKIALLKRSVVHRGNRSVTSGIKGFGQLKPRSFEEKWGVFKVVFEVVFVLSDDLHAWLGLPPSIALWRRGKDDYAYFPRICGPKTPAISRGIGCTAGKVIICE
jgi:hypothetical protein